MFQFYLGLYGLAALFCLLGYIYAWIDWALGNRTRVRPAVIHTSTPGTVSSHVDSNGEIATCAPAVDIPVQEPQQAFKEKHTTEAPPLDEFLYINDQMEGSSSTTEEQQKSWNERRRERRQRYKREKLQNQIQREREKRLLALEESQNEDSMNSEADLSAGEAEFSEILKEILQAHEMCSRRESIQVTDLDDKLCSASIHVVEAHSWLLAEDSTMELLVSPTEEQLLSVKVNETNLASHCDPPELYKMQESQEIGVAESTPPASNPVDKSRRYSVRSRRIFDECFEMVDRNFFAPDRKVGALDGFYFASFSVDSALRSGPQSQINLVEDQCVECLNADNPDCWVAKVHPVLNRSASLQKRGRRDSALPDSSLAKDNQNEGAPTNGLHSPQTNGHSENERPDVGRVNSVCLTRILRGTAKGKRDPRELFREEVITISNKQQESKMKRRYALTELIETEREYVKALTPLLDALTRFGTRVTLHLGEATEETIDIPKPLQQCIRNLRDKLKKIIDFTEKTLLDELAACTMNPPSAAECFIRNAAALEHYSIYLLHLDAFVKQLTLINGPDSDALFVLQDSSSPPRSPTENGDSTSALCNQRTSITYKYLLELFDLPKLRLLAYRVLLRDVARYTSQAGASTEQLEHGMTVIARTSRRTEETLMFWTKINQTTSECVEWINMYKNKRTGNLMPPALVRLTDLETNIRTGLRPISSETKKGRLILLPQHILFLQKQELSDTWDISWIIKLDGLRIGASELSDKQPPWFEIWNTEGSDPTKKIVRIYCADTLSQNAWMEDIRRALMNLLQCGDEETLVDSAVVSAHEEADLRKRLKFAHVMELPAFRSDSLEDFFVDALDDLQKQQATFSSVDDIHNGQKPQVVDLVSMSTATSKKQDSSTSSSYHTAEELSDHQTSCAKETSTTLYESYTTLDDVRTPFSEDQRSIFEDNLENKEDSMPLDAPPGAVVKTLTVGAGEQIQFNASFTISGPIAYEVTWMMNGLPIPPTIDADMILSDTDTRLLIGHADPAVHSGTYACRCRLFDGTQTAVYFYVNVVPKEPEPTEEDEEQAEEQVTVSEIREPAHRSSLPQAVPPAVVLTPVTRQLNIPIGQVLELGVKVEREVLVSVLCNFKGLKDKKAVQPVLVDWYHDDVLLQPSSNCIMSEQEGMVTLQTVTTNFMPDQQSEYKCVLRLPNEYSEVVQLNTSIIVNFHEPTQEELANGFTPVASLAPPTHESLPKAVSISDLIDIQLIQGQRFHLVAPFDLQSANDDLAIWWTHNDEIIASRNFDMDNVKNFKCLLNKNNQTIKLVKPTAEKADVGLYTCWVSDVGEKKNGQKCIEYAVDILESDSELDSEIRSQLEDELSQVEQEFLNEEVFVIEQTDESLEEQSDIQNQLELKQPDVCGETNEDEQQHVQLAETLNLEEEFGCSDQKQPQHTVDVDVSEWSKPVEEQNSYRDLGLVPKVDGFEESTKENEEISEEKSAKEKLSTACDDRQTEEWTFTKEIREDRLNNALEQEYEVGEDGPSNEEQWQQQDATVRTREADKFLKHKETSIQQNRHEDENEKGGDGSKLENVFTVYGKGQEETEDRTSAEEEQKRKAEEEQFKAEERKRQEEEKLFVLEQLKQMTEDVEMIQVIEDGQYVGKQIAKESEWTPNEGEIEPQREEEATYCDNCEVRHLAGGTLEDEKELDNIEMGIGGESDEGKLIKKQASALMADRSKNELEEKTRHWVSEEEKKQRSEEEEERIKLQGEKRRDEEEEKKDELKEEKEDDEKSQESERKVESELATQMDGERKITPEEEKMQTRAEGEEETKPHEEKKTADEEDKNRRRKERVSIQLDDEEEHKQSEDVKKREDEEWGEAKLEEQEKQTAEERKKVKLAEERKCKDEEENARLEKERVRRAEGEEEEEERKAEEKEKEQKAEEEEVERRAEEEENKHKAEEAEKKQRAEEEEEEKKCKAEEEEMMRKAEEEEKKRKAEEEKKKRKAEEEEEKRKAEEEKAKLEEEEEKKRKAEEEKKAKLEEEKKRKAEEEEKKRKTEEEEKKRKAEEEVKKRKAEEEKKAKLEEEEEKKRKAEEEEKKRKAEEEKKAKLEEEKKRKAEEEKKAKLEEEKKRKAEEEEKKRKAEEEEKKRKAEEEKRANLEEKSKRKVNETAQKRMDEQKTEIEPQEEGQSKKASLACTEGEVGVAGFDIVDFERGVDAVESRNQKDLADVLEEEMEKPASKDEELNRRKDGSRKRKKKKDSEKSDAASMNKYDSRGVEFTALSNGQITGLSLGESNVPTDKVFVKTFEADSVKEDTMLAKGQHGEETIEKGKDRKRRKDVDPHEKKVGNRRPSRRKVDQPEVVAQQGNQAETVKEETTFLRSEEKHDIAPDLESVGIITSREIKDEGETRIEAENEHIKTIGQETDSRPLLFTIEHKTSELERAAEHVQKTDDSICIPLAEAVALSGQSLLSAVKGHSFKISVTDLPNIPLKLSWYLNDELITEDELLPPGTNTQNGVVDVCHMPSATLYIRNLTEADTGIYHLKIVDLEGNADEALGPLATVDVPVKLKKRARDKVKRSEDTPATSPFGFEKLRCTDLSTPITEGSNLELVARFPTFGLDYDENDFQWLADGNAVSNKGSLVRVDTDETQGHVSLVIPNIQPEHAGTYSIRFSDNAQKRIKDNAPTTPPMGDLSKALVFPPLVILKRAMSCSERWQPSKYRPSAFDRELPPSTSIKEGEHAKLEARLGRNHEIFDHEWLVNGKPILPEFTSDYTIWRADNLLALTIPRMRRDLAGIYELRVFGEQDVYTTSTDLIVEPSRAKISSYKLTSADGLKPLFTKRLQDYEVDVGDCVRFTARVMAEPPAVIVWKHNGSIVTGDHRIKLFNDDANPSLTIRHARPEDRGRYCCIATNALGRVDTEGVLQVHDTDRYVPLGNEFDAGGSVAGRKEIGGSKRTALPRTAPEVALVSMSVSNIDLRWKPIQSDEGVTYIVELSKDGGKWWKPIITGLRETHASVSEELASPLEPVQIRVVGENEFGTGPASAPPVRIPARACIPTMPQVKPDIEFEEAASVLIKWPKATASIMEHTLLTEHVISPSAMLGQVWYAVEVREGAQSEWRRVATNLKNQFYTYHLRPGASTAIRVVAANRFGESSPTPIGLTHLDPNSLAPNLDFNPPWVSLSRPVSDDGSTYEIQPLGVTVYWKPAYMPEFCSSCVRGLEPMYRLEWRRGRSGMWQALADDLTDPEAGFRLPTDLVLALQDDAKRMKDSRSLVTLNSQAIELRLFCWNKYGESGPTKPCRLVASELFRGQLYKNSTVMDKDSMQLSQITDVLQELDQLPVMSANDRCSRLLTRISSLSTTEGIGLSWEKFTLTGLPKASGDQPPEPHGRYRIEKYIARPTSPMDSPNTNQTDWKVASLDAAVIYGEDFILDTRPDKEEQIYRLLALNETETCSMWVDGYNRIRIPSLSELVPSAPTDLTIQCVPVNDSTISAENHINWKPANQHPLLVELSPSSELVEAKELANPPLDLRYRIEARSTLSELSPWRQVAEVYGGTTSVVDRKAEPGLALIYRITPINRFGEGSSVTSPPIRTPILYSALEGCIEDVRSVILGPTEIQLRWRLGDAAIDALKHDQPNTWGRKRSLCRSGSVDYSERVSFTVEVRGGYAGDWSPAVEQIQGDLNAKALLQDCHYLEHDISCRVVALIDGQRSAPSRPIRLNVRADAMTPDYTFVKPKVHVETVEEYVISWDEPDVQEIYSSHTLGLTTPQTLQRGMNYAVQVQRESKPQWETIATQLKEPHYTWAQPNPLQAYHVRVLPANQFGTGIPSRSVRVEPQVVIPDLSFIRPSIEAPADILAGSTAPELVWQLPRAYSLEKTLTPVTYEVQVRGVANASRLALGPVPHAVHSASRQSAADDDETVWRVLETNVKRTRLPLGRLDPEQEFWLRIVAVTDYGRGAPSQSVRKLVDLAAKRQQRMSASIVTIHEATPVSPTFADPKGTVLYAPVGGRLELRSNLQTIQPDADIRFSWSLNDRPIEIPETAQQNRLSRYQSYVSKTSDVAVLQVHNLTESDFGVYICKAVNIRGSTTKEFIVKKADAPVFLEVPVPVMTIKLHCSFELPCWVDAVPTATLYWTRDSKRVGESHRTKIGSRMSRTKEDAQCFTINASLSVDRCIYQDAGLYTLVAENIAGRVQTSCLIRVEESPIPKYPTLRWTDVGLHYYVLRRLEKGDISELRLLIDKQTNQEYVGKLYFLDDPIGRVAGAREFECLSRLCHSNVVQLHDAIVSDNVLVLVMERLTGPNLLKAMLHCNNWSESATASVVRQVLEALQHLHCEGVVHLDLQPENLLFARNVTAETWDGQTSYTDLFKALSPLVSDTMGLRETDRHKMSVLSSLIKLVGFSSAEPLVNKSNADPVYCYPPQRFRPEYSAPEVLVAASQSASTDAEPPILVGPAADMWSVGVLTYVLLTGWCPFFDMHTSEPLREQILSASFTMDLSEFDSISDNAKQFVRDLLQINPGSRPTATECLQHPWLSTLKNSDGQDVEYRLERLPIYYEAYKSKRARSSPTKEKQPTPSKSLSPTDIDRGMLDSTLSDTHLDNHRAKLAQDVRQRIRQLSCGPAHGEGSLSDISSRASSIPSFSDVLDPHEPDSEITGGHGHIPSMDDASLELRSKLTLLRQDTLTDAVPIEDEAIHVNGIEEAGDQTEKKITSKSTKRDSSSQPLIPAAAPTFASPLRDAYFNIHSGEARFSCQLAGFAHLPPGIHGHREAIAELYPTDVVNAQTGHSSATVAAWYLGGCLLSDGPGVQLGTGPGGWLWLYLSELNVDQAGTVVKCVVRNRAGKAKTQARLLIADPPKPPGRPGMAEVHPTEALITWAPSDVDVDGDLIYRVDAKFAANNGPAAWHTLGFTVDCRFLAMNLQPGLCYRMRVSAGNSCGWGNYSIASSEFYTPTDRSSEVISLLSKDDREWMLTWRQSTDIYALSEHPVAVQFGMALSNVVPLPVSDKSLQKLQCHDGLITDLEVLREVCTPEYLVYRGKFSKMLVARTNPMLTDRGEAAQDQLILPPRLFLRITEISGDDECTEQRARQEAILMTGLNTSSGGMFASVDDYFSGIDTSYLFTAARHLLPCGASLAWLTNDAVKPSIGVSVSYWIPGGQLFDVLVSRTEYTEFSIMRWTQQLLMALRWLYSKLFGRPHGAIIPRHILAARRSSTLPDIVLTGFGGSNEEINGRSEFTAPEVSQGETISVFSDLWSIGALNYLLMTGNCPDAKLAETSYKVLAETTTDEEKPKLTGHQGDPHIPHYIDFKKLHMFSKPAKKLVYNCLQLLPKKRGHIDFWLESRWFDISTENVQRLTRTPIPISQLNTYRLRHTDSLRIHPSTDASDIQLP
ncbi:hypothetical protein CRM22_005285 [Opisthorchis felineus]|uniref:Ig-like domain-containing protein n=1 Tax=Opisthorchis felineus TaxID=147828 RepID=A0A4S2LRW1_OPIFE|nr:hypothetical protein CRM22_005285 [Opisthorchis felineus]